MGTMAERANRHRSAAEAEEHLCTRALLRGDLEGARWHAEYAAYELHLERELRDTADIAFRALLDAYDERRATRTSTEEPATTHGDLNGARAENTDVE
ncbi:hypothetical protein [Sinomonas sp. ASV322]|uniref:hypothetical protein n=1 Tax=Sinomonas sp. ASV322 TaxID=3041920 RepID=UPI0027DB481A|nr:hypothetical protein [Sinomonas sp. ASV322]MDQ4502208.1 hypothetical protein [Sinomonas sp. ASV322]